MKEKVQNANNACLLPNYSVLFDARFGKGIGRKRNRVQPNLGLFSLIMNSSSGLSGNSWVVEQRSTVVTEPSAPPSHMLSLGLIAPWVVEA